MSEPQLTGLSKAQLDALSDLSQLAAGLSDRRLLLMGATARLLQLDWPLGLVRRTTRDVDLALHIHSWQEHADLVRVACRTEFETDPRQPQRLVHRTTRELLDLVPFGELENPPGTLRWPAGEREMTVHGMQEAENTAEILTLRPGATIGLVTLPCFVMLKLFAWKDRGPMGKGADDLRDVDIVLRECGQLRQYEAKQWEAYEAAVEACGSPELDFGDHAGAAVMALELVRVLSGSTRSSLLPVLEPLRDPYGQGIEHLLGARLGTDEEPRRRMISKRYDILWQLLAVGGT